MGYMCGFNCRVATFVLSQGRLVELQMRDDRDRATGMAAKLLPHGAVENMVGLFNT